MAERESKGFFGGCRIPVAQRYVIPFARGRVIWLGLGLAVAVLALAAVDWARGGRWLEAGALSSNHAGLEAAGGCVTCHVGFRSAESEKCSACHERFHSAFAVHGFDAHYLYESAD